MSKKVKLEVILRIDKEISIDESMIQRSVGLLGEVDSYNLSENIESTPTSTQPSDVDSSNNSISGISELINNANKIYYGTLTIDQRAIVALAIFKYSNFESISNDPSLKDKIISIFTNKFGMDEATSKKNLEGDINSQNFEDLKSKFLEGDLTQMFIYIWEKTLSSEEEDPFETELVESMQLSFGFEPASVNETKKQGNDRAKINKSINIIKSGSTAYNKLKALLPNFKVCGPTTKS